MNTKTSNSARVNKTEHFRSLIVRETGLVTRAHIFFPLKFYVLLVLLLLFLSVIYLNFHESKPLLQKQVQDH